MRTLRKLSDINLFFNNSYRVADVDLNQLYKGVTRDLNKLDPDHVVKREEDIAVPGPVKLNKTFLRIILLYVMENAILFRNDDREDSLVRLKIFQKGLKLIIRVEDNGLGVPEEVVPKVFNMFYRGSEKSKGNGLGLYLVEKAVTALGGTCRIESELNEYFIFKAEILLERFN